MISIKQLSDSTLSKHWDYFIASPGYTRINEYANEVNLSIEERAFYQNLLDDEPFLKKILLGTPNDLLQTIDKFSIEFQKIPQLKVLLLPVWKDIYKTINNKAKNILSAGEVIQNKRNILNDLFIIDDLCVENGVYANFQDNENFINLPTNKLTIKKIKALYKTLLDVLLNLTNASVERLTNIFDYKAFTLSYTSWGAYSLTKDLGVTVCPYCNRSYVHTIDTPTGKTRPELDHYYPKSRFPFLALSIHNLIPSCHICNSNLKGSIDFHKNDHIHPFLDDLSDQFLFTVKLKENTPIVKIVPDIDDFDIEIEITNDNPTISNKIKNSTETFKLKKLYNQHKDIAIETLEKAVYYNETRIGELNNFFNPVEPITNDNRPEIKLDESIIKFVLGNYIENKNIGKRTLAKFTRDIAMGTDLKKYI